MKNTKICGIGIALMVLTGLTGCASEAADSHKQGMKLYEEGKYTQAAQYLTEAVAENNAKASYYVDLGMNYIELENYALAKDAFDHAVSLGDELELAYRGLGIMCTKQGLYEDAISYFNHAIETVELNVGNLEYDILQYRAEAELMAGKYQDALKTYETLISLEVDTAQNYIYCGNASLQMGEEKNAEEYYQNALKINGNDLSMYFRIYNAYKEVMLEETGETYLKKALEIQGDTDEAHLNRGKIYYLMKNYTNAITELSYPLMSNNSEAALYTALCYEMQGEYEAAIETYVKSLEQKNDPVLSNYLALCYEACGEYNKAWNMVHTTMESFPDCDIMQDLKWNEIILYEKMEMYPSAYTRLLEYKEAYPSDPNIELELQFLKLKQS